MKFFKCTTTDSARLQIYEFIAAPAHLWLWLCARLCGGRFVCGPVSDPDEELVD